VRTAYNTVDDGVAEHSGDDWWWTRLFPGTISCGDAWSVRGDCTTAAVLRMSTLWPCLPRVAVLSLIALCLFRDAEGGRRTGRCVCGIIVLDKVFVWARPHIVLAFADDIGCGWKYR